MSVAAEPNRSVECDPRWTRVLRRDPTADGLFVFAVRTTGIYCRPSCPARTAKAHNVCFFSTPQEAEHAGYRACQRCHPNGPSRAAVMAATVTAACRRIEESDGCPPVDELAAAAGLSPSHFHRQFKRLTGLTPKAYGAADRAKKIRAGLSNARLSVTQAIYAAGFNSSSRFYEKSDAVLGMTPTEYKHGGKGATIRFAVGQCSLGAILVAGSPRGVCAITLGDDPAGLVRDLQDRFPTANLIGADEAFERLVARVVALVESPATDNDLPLDIRGTAFQQRVWQALRQIPPGETRSYAEIARRIGRPRAVRAVAQACGANAIAVAIPCHRVIRHDGTPPGYRWGIQRKLALLKRERSGAER